MYGFGDDQTPYEESVDLVEEMMMDYVVRIMHKAIAAGSAKGGRPTAEDLIFLVRKDPPKFARVKELLFMQKELADAKKMLFDNDLNAAAGAMQDA